MAPIGCPEHTRIQKSRRDVIKDERKRVMVTSEVEPVDGLTDNQEQNSKEKQKGELEAEKGQQKRNPRQCGFHFADYRPRCSAHQAIEIFLPAFPHRTKRSIHPRSNQSLTGTKPNPVARLLHAQGNRHVFEYFSGNAAVTTNRIVGIPANQKELAIRSSDSRLRIVDAFIRKLLRQPQIDER